MIAALALAAIEAPEVRMDRLHERMVAASPDLCRSNACPLPVIGETKQCAVAVRYTITFDRDCFARLTDPEAVLIIGHESAHIMGIKSHRGADWIGYAMTVRAGFDGQQAVQVFTKLSSPLAFLTSHGTNASRMEALK